jgi:transcriptional regulator with XRE-family HTH domain
MIRIKLREAAQEKGISQAKLSRKADVDLRTIQRIYKNPYTNINLVTLDKLATALQIDAALLIESV